MLRRDLGAAKGCDEFLYTISECLWHTPRLGRSTPHHRAPYFAPKHA
jgi:hypothetical protein